MTNNFRPNPAFETEVRQQPRFRRLLNDAGKDVAGHANRFAKAAGAPWMRRKAMARNRPIVVDDDGDKVYVVNTDHGGHLLEWGSKNNPPHGPLRRGVRAAGLKLRQ